MNSWFDSFLGDFALLALGVLLIGLGRIKSYYLGMYKGKGSRRPEAVVLGSVLLIGAVLRIITRIYDFIVN